MSRTFNMVGGGAGGGIKLLAIDITKAPDKVNYRPGQTFDPTGMEVTATYSNGATLLATGWTYSPTGALAEGAQSVTIVYTEGGVTAQATQAITVQKASFAVPSQETPLVYTGGQQTPQWDGYDSAEMTIGGTSAATDAGTYQATFSLKDKVGTQWADGTTEDKTVSWSIGRASVSTPTQSGTLTYTGNPQTPSWSGYDSSKMTMGGTTSGTNAGNYNATFTPTSNYQWTDGSTGAKTVAWSIQKAAGSLSISPESMTLDTSTTSKVITVTRAGTGAISAQSSAPGVASVQVNGNQVTVTGLANGSATITISVAADTNYNAPANKTCSVQVTLTQVYGVEWDGTQSTVWSRTDAAETFVNPSPAVNNGNGSSPFDDLMPWSGMEVVDDATAGKLVKIPKYWYKWTRSGSTMKLQIADGPEEGFHVSPAHADRGDGQGERDVVYVGRYHCASNYKSQAGGQPVTNMTRAQARSSIHNLGGTIWQYDFAMYWTIMMLYLVEYANWNSQATIGYGCSPSSSKFNMGATDAMQYHTGTSAANRTTYGSIQYRHIEGLWDNVYDWCDGIYFSGANVYCTKNPASFSDTSGGTQVGTRATQSGWISAWTNPTADGFEYALYPNAVAGSESTFVCDYCSYSAGGVVLRVGGNYGQSHYHGAFFLYGDSAASNQSSYIGCRLQKLP